LTNVFSSTAREYRTARVRAALPTTTTNATPASARGLRRERKLAVIASLFRQILRKKRENQNRKH
jgi:hypothetical protein